MKSFLVEPKFVEYLRINYPYVWRTQIHYYLPFLVMTTLILYKFGSTNTFTLDNFPTFEQISNQVWNIRLFIISVSIIWIIQLLRFPLSNTNKLRFLQAFMLYFICIVSADMAGRFYAIDKINSINKIPEITKINSEQIEKTLEDEDKFKEFDDIKESEKKLIESIKSDAIILDDLVKKSKVHGFGLREYITSIDRLKEVTINVDELSKKFEHSQRISVELDKLAKEIDSSDTENELKSTLNKLKEIDRKNNSFFYFNIGKQKTIVEAKKYLEQKNSLIDDYSILKLSSYFPLFLAAYLLLISSSFKNNLILVLGVIFINILIASLFESIAGREYTTIVMRSSHYLSVRSIMRQDYIVFMMIFWYVSIMWSARSHCFKKLILAIISLPICLVFLPELRSYDNTFILISVTITFFSSFRLLFKEKYFFKAVQCYCYFIIGFIPFCYFFLELMFTATIVFFCWTILAVAVFKKIQQHELYPKKC